MAASRNSSSSLSERESVTRQDTTLHIQGKKRSRIINTCIYLIFANWPGANSRSVKRHASGKHRVASSYDWRGDGGGGGEGEGKKSN